MRRFVLTRLWVGLILLAQAIAPSATARSFGDGVDAQSCSRAQTLENPDGAARQPASDGSSRYHHDRCLLCPASAAAPPELCLTVGVGPSDLSWTRPNWVVRVVRLGRLRDDPNVFARAGPTIS